MAEHKADRSKGRGKSGSSRRDFIQKAAGVAAGIAALPSAATATESSTSGYCSRRSSWVLTASRG